MPLQTLSRVEKQWEFAETHYKSKRHPDHFPELPEIPAGRYTSQEFFRIEKEYLWKRTWLFAAVADELPSVGTYKTLSINEISVLLVRGNDNVIRAFYNTCQHRGSMLASKAQGHVQKFVCPYHCWTYNLEGKLTFVTDERLFPGLDKSKKSLKPIRCESFGNLIFVNLNANADPLKAFLGDVLDVLADMPMDNLGLYKKIQLEAPYNWKLAQENFSEAYHSASVHPSSINPLLDTKAWAPLLLANGHAASAIRFRRNKDGSVVNLWKSSVSDGKTVAARGSSSELMRVSQRNCNMFPNITLSPAEDIFPLITVWPISVASCRLDIYFLKVGGCDQRASDTTDEAMVDGLKNVLKEDFEALRGIQTSLGGGGIDGIRLGWEEQFVYHHSQQMDRVIGRNNIPAGLSVKDAELQLATPD